MAAAAPSRPSEPNSYTPRPSISPLSVRSAQHKSSPTTIRDADMQDIELPQPLSVDNAASTTITADLGGSLDDRSSSLSDPDEDNDDVEPSNGVDDEVEDIEEQDAQRSLDVDSEAETERIEPTPQKLRKHADDLGRTTSKLSQAATAEEELSDPPSPTLLGPGAASSTSTVATAGQKRKRSDTADSSLTSAESDIGESPRKRSHELQDDVIDTAEDTIEDAEQAEDVIDTAEDAPATEQTREAFSASARGGRGGRKGKMKGRKSKLQTEETEATPAEEVAEPEEEQPEQDPAKREEELQRKNEASTFFEDVTKQFRAFKEKLCNERLAAVNAELQVLTQPDCAHPEYLRQIQCVDARLEKQRREAYAFYNYKQRSIRDRTLGDRSQFHSQYYQYIRDLREDALYKLGEDWYAIQKERRQSHQEEDEKYVYKYRPKKSAQIRQQAKYNQEVSVLSGVAKYVGFPAAPDIGGAEGGDFDDDLKAMKIPKRSHLQHTTVSAATAAPQPQKTYYGPPTAVQLMNNESERVAHERFIEQNAWARPQAPIHAHGLNTPGISHTPDWADPTAGSTARALVRNLSGLQRTSSPAFMTPLPQQKRSGPLEFSSSGTVAVNSDGVEAPSSVLAAPPAGDRIGLLHHQHQDLNNGNPTSSNQVSPVTLPKQRDTHLTGFRNISNLSGTSTISTPIDIHNDRRLSDRPRTLPELLSQSSAPQQTFDTSQIHRLGSGSGEYSEGKRETYPNVGFRLQVGDFGTPGPMGGTGGLSGSIGLG